MGRAVNELAELQHQLAVLQRSQRRMKRAFAALTVAAAGGLLMGAAATGNARFDVLDVERINLREADGTLRMVIANRQRFPVCTCTTPNIRTIGAVTRAACCSSTTREPRTAG